MTTEDLAGKPHKVWSCDRQTRKCVVASSLDELRTKGAAKLGYNNPFDLKVVLEEDGTEVEDENYFQRAERDTVFLMLQPNEKWLPPGVEALRAAITAIPRIVCDAIASLELMDLQPSWKIMDNKGRVTVVLHWDQHEKCQGRRGPGSEPGGVLRVEVSSQEAQAAGAMDGGAVGTVPRTRLTLEGLGPRPESRTLPPRTGSRDSATAAAPSSSGNNETGSPDHNHAECDFHCAALHGSHQIQVNKSVATSPIQEFPPRGGPFPGTSGMQRMAPAQQPQPSTSGGKGQHVRFLEVTEEARIPAVDDSESDTENTACEEEQLTERYLLLVDQLSLEQDRHLTVRDIGVILERLGSRIVDVDRLERERESADIHNWTIKATLRGEVLREIGVIYNGQYYGIMEHPGYF
ncbi:hypothetical protein HPB50_024228 [Hyalomma asiaticum]|uniref:Uncharacterized protein n=1 Tax=Hyalomma asiaticum TaxID=266040 RepID=A0ACB7SKJ0_HYAAI|nr:hypothetical protein HPB50_024228 [Hyalomma asiaticum]